MEGENNNNEVEELNEKDGKIINREIVDEMKTAYIDYDDIEFMNLFIEN